MHYISHTSESTGTQKEKKEEMQLDKQNVLERPHPCILLCNPKILLSILQSTWEKEGSNLTCPILQLILWQIRITLNLEIPAVQLDNGPIFYMAQDLGHWLICVTLAAECYQSFSHG